MFHLLAYNAVILLQFIICLRNFFTSTLQISDDPLIRIMEVLCAHVQVIKENSQLNRLHKGVARMF